MTLAVVVIMDIIAAQAGFPLWVIVSLSILCVCIWD